MVTPVLGTQAGQDKRLAHHPDVALEQVFQGDAPYELSRWLRQTNLDPPANCKSPANPDRGDMETSIVRSIAEGEIGRLKSSVGGKSTSIGVRRRGGGVSINPGEPVVVVMLPPPSVFLDFPERASTTIRSLSNR